MWWWDINLVSQKSADIPSNLFAFHYFPFPTDIYFKKKLILYKISFKKKKSKTAVTCKGKIKEDGCNTIYSINSTLWGYWFNHAIPFKVKRCYPACDSAYTTWYFR